jgi:glutathione S-transferase
MTEKLTMVFWPAQMYGGSTRLVLSSAGIDHDDHVLADYGEWFGGDNKVVAATNPLVNLPHLRTPSGDVIVQSGAMLRYLGRTYNLYGETPLDMRRIDQVMDTANDFDQELHDVAMVQPEEYAEAKEGFKHETLAETFGRFDAFMKLNNTTYIASNTVSIADYVVFQSIRCAELCYGADAEWMAGWPTLLAYFTAFAAKPAVAAFLATPAAGYPFNAPNANFSAIEMDADTMAFVKKQFENARPLQQQFGSRVDDE